VSAAPVPQIDLAAQYATIAHEIEPVVLEVLRSQRYVLGDYVARFEREIAAYVGSPHAIGVASGSDALLLALRALEVGPGDEVVTTAFSFFATASAITRLGAVPVFADIRRDDFLLDAAAVGRALTSRTRAILPVHLYGQCIDFAAFAEVAREHRLPIVEDAAQAIGATRDGVAAGTFGDLACFSFYPTKNLGAAGDAGLVTTGSEPLATRVRRLREHGSVRRYEHLEVGFNSRLDALQAAVLSVKLRHVDLWSDARAAHAARYDELLRATGLVGTVTLPVSQARTRHIFHQYVLRVPRRDALREHLRARGVGSEIYYPIPLHLQRCFASLGYTAGALPETERAAAEVLALPMYAELSDEQQERVVDAIAAFYR
jgi:dTDP-4-amino-4,6-dideoxygalactose transaminase